MDRENAMERFVVDNTGKNPDHKPAPETPGYAGSV